MAKLKVLVACGAGIATSTVVMKRVEDLFKSNNIDVDIIQIKIAEAKAREADADMLITTTLLLGEFSIPAIKAMGYLTGINADKVDEQVLEAARSILG
ncbi:PTS sugar transporter subunit IIB [Streptococcus cuniculi]|uniref:PTS galactitol transporter subunit IIB n=1 Tax=Streptococcus cuniculi TaxID=1432788 RepID=A0A4Y9JB54_9STRE|nr:PTS sugar transporter subunit IIB [Streptococcus cuniculi]MBF0777951.1 PTS sugar transporter subunit IIB [Streptococcus cuniculi]TFU98243.1 PTS galactitol transporter subunit IIB [Streptococcus cuniculi]